MISIISLWAIASTLLLIAFFQSQINAKLRGSLEKLQKRIEVLENHQDMALKCQCCYSKPNENWISAP